MLEVSAFVIQQPLFITFKEISLKEKMAHIFYSQIYLQLRDWGWCAKVEVFHHCNCAEYSIGGSKQKKGNGAICMEKLSCLLRETFIVYYTEKAKIFLVCYSQEKRWFHWSSTVFFLFVMYWALFDIIQVLKVNLQFYT